MFTKPSSKGRQIDTCIPGHRSTIEIKPDTQPSGVGTSGTVVEVPTTSGMQLLVDFVCVHTSGNANFTDVTMYEQDPNSGGGELDVVAEWSDLASDDPIHDQDIGALFDYEIDSLWVEIVPDTGSSNDYELKARCRA